MMEQYFSCLSYLLAALVVVYLHRIMFFYRGLSRLITGKNHTVFDVCIIVPARNEERNIRRCLASLTAQTYPHKKFSIIVVDDNSTDNTASRVEEFALTSPVPVFLIHATEFVEVRSPKIRALSHGIQHTPASIIMTTDADCTVPAHWVTSIISHFDDSVGIVTGMTIFEKTTSGSSLFWGMQFLDFISYTSITAGAIGMGRVLISNGSNMAFRRAAFDESGGFEPLLSINTGDDSLLAQSIVRSKKWQARFAFGDDATVTTTPAENISEMFQQRLRWVGQTAYYPPYMLFFMICTFVLFVGLMIALPVSLVTGDVIPWIVVAVKFTVDFIIMTRFTRITQTRHLLKYFIPTAVIHIPMILISTVGGYFFSFRWKERTMKKESA